MFKWRLVPRTQGLDNCSDALAGIFQHPIGNRKGQPCSALRARAEGLRIETGTPAWRNSCQAKPIFDRPVRRTPSNMNTPTSGVLQFNCRTRLNPETTSSRRAETVTRCVQIVSGIEINRSIQQTKPYRRA
jgi:hypothetical protein